MRPRWIDVDDPATFVRTVLAVEAPDIPDALVTAYAWTQTTMPLDVLRLDQAMLDRHDRDPVHIARRNGFVGRIRAGEPIPPLIVLGLEPRDGTEPKLVDGYARYRALRLLGCAHASVLRQWQVPSTR